MELQAVCIGLLIVCCSAANVGRDLILWYLKNNLNIPFCFIFKDFTRNTQCKCCPTPNRQWTNGVRDTISLYGVHSNTAQWCNVALWRIDYLQLLGAHRRSLHPQSSAVYPSIRIEQYAIGRSHPVRILGRPSRSIRFQILEQRRCFDSNSQPVDTELIYSSDSSANFPSNGRSICRQTDAGLRLGWDSAQIGSDATLTMVIDEGDLKRTMR